MRSFLCQKVDPPNHQSVSRGSPTRVWRPVGSESIRPVVPPAPLLDTPLPPPLASMQWSILHAMQEITKLDLTISAMCQRRMQLQNHVVSEQLCLYECLAAHTSAGSLIMQGATHTTDGNDSAGPNRPPVRNSRKRDRGQRSPGNAPHDGADGRGCSSADGQPGMVSEKQVAPLVVDQMRGASLPPPELPGSSKDSLVTVHPAILAAAPIAVQERLLGQKLFSAVSKRQPHLAEQITSVMLGRDNNELLAIIQSESLIAQHIEDCLQIIALAASTSQSACAGELSALIQQGAQDHTRDLELAPLHVETTPPTQEYPVNGVLGPKDVGARAADLQEAPHAGSTGGTHLLDERALVVDVLEGPPRQRTDSCRGRSFTRESFHPGLRHRGERSPARPLHDRTIRESMPPLSFSLMQSVLGAESDLVPDPCMLVLGWLLGDRWSPTPRREDLWSQPCRLAKQKLCAGKSIERNCPRQPVSLAKQRRFFRIVSSYKRLKCESGVRAPQGSLVGQGMGGHPSWFPAVHKVWSFLRLQMRHVKDGCRRISATFRSFLRSQLVMRQVSRHLGS